MLSGFDGDEHEWVNWGLCDAVEFLTRGGQIQPMIVAMPGGDHSWWFNHAPPPGGDGRRWGDYVWKDVVQEMDAKFRTLPAPSSRAIGGLSAGGQSALMLAMTHPEVFGIVGAHSPSFRGADGSVPNFGTWDYFNQYDPIWLAEHSDGVERLSIWVDIGGDDTQWRDCNPPPSPQRCAVVFNQILNTRDIPHQWHADWPGIHDDYYWGAHLVDYLTWYSSVLASGPP
jgi:S-formylglutathione hydrolase FrmB